MAEAKTVVVRMFGLLGALRSERGLETTVDIEVPPEGVPASEIAASLDLPPELIEGMFCNHLVYGMEHVVRPGDRIAFVPYGTPGPHRVFLGLFDSGRGGQR